MGKSCAADMANSGKLSEVGNLPALDQMVEADGEGHHLSDARYVNRRWLLGLRPGFDDSLGGW